MKDKFSLIVMIAFDEMCTCRAYAADREFYAGLGSSFLRCQREVVADEAVHSMNAVNVLRARYCERIPEIGEILDSIILSVGRSGLYRHLRTGLLRRELHEADVCQQPRRCPEKRC
ncbi:hypothetical protein ACVWWR_004647 [Bradyrhizobium sp. LM3.2]